ncbi:MAG: exo-alpha-sialidase [Promethearchaeota archaeon]
MFETQEIFGAFGCGAEPGQKGSNHGSNICEGPDGELIAVWYGGTGEKHHDVQLWMSKKPAGASSWQEPWVCEKEGKTSRIPEEMEEFEGHSSEGNPVLYFEREQNRLHLWWVTIYGFGNSRGWSTGFIKYKHSDDLGKTWVLKDDGTPRLLHDFWGEMIKNKPIKLSNGDMLLPAMTEWTSYSPVYYKCSAAEFKSGCVDSTWRKIQSTGTGCFQPTLAEVEPGKILSLMRAAKGSKFFPKAAQMESADFGETWSMPRVNDFDFFNCNANADMVKLRNGHLVYVFNDSPESRNPLTVALSEDGRTWKYKKNIVYAPDEPTSRFAYPAVIQGSNDLIHVTYSNTNRKGRETVSDNIKWACFDEGWIKK